MLQGTGWKRRFSGVRAGPAGPVHYSVGWDRLRDYEDLLCRRLRHGPLTAIHPYAENGFWNAELEALERRGDVTLLISDACPGTYTARANTRGFRVKRYRPGRDAHVHVKLDLFEGEHERCARLTSAQLATRRLGPLAVGMRGLGRSEMYFLTNHGEIMAEARAFARSLTRDELPRSGRYLRIESPADDGIYPALCRDLRNLAPGAGRILHFRASYHDRAWRPEGQRSEGLLELHMLLHAHARAGTPVCIAYGEPSRAARARMAMHAGVGAQVGFPRAFPGTWRAPYGLVPVFERLPVLRKFKLGDHFNVTILEGVRDEISQEPHAVIYFGHKSDIPYDRGTLELMLRCDSLEFPGLDEGLRDLVLSRVRVQAPGRGVPSGAAPAERSAKP